MKNFIKGFFLFVLFTSGFVFPQKKKLTFEQVFMFAQPRLTQPLPSFVKWSDAGAILRYGNKYTLADYDFGTSDYLDYSELTADLPEDFKTAQLVKTGDDLLHYIFSKNGNLYYFSAEDNEYKQLTALKGEEKNPEFSPDYSKVAFTNNHNLYVVNISDGLITQLTDDGSDAIKNGYASWVYYEEILGRSSRYRAFYWDKNSEYLAFLKFDDSTVPRFPLFKADGVHGEIEWEYYPKAGDPDPKVWLGLANVKTGEITWIDSATHSEKYVAWIFFTPENKLFYETVNRAQDSLKFFVYDIGSGSRKKVYEEYQSSWVDFIDEIHFEKNRFYFISDYEGVGKVYCYDYSGKKIGSYGNDNLNFTHIKRIDGERNIFCEGFPLGSVDNYLYEIRDGKIKRLTKESGYHTVYVSPDGKFALDYFSSLTTPQKIIAMNFQTGKDSVLYDSKSENFDEYELASAKAFYVENRDGLKLPAVEYFPPNFDETKKYPVLFYVYGGPGTPIVKNRFPRWLLQYYFAQLGIIVVSVDNRGAGHYGKKVLAQLHRNLGRYDLDDFIDAGEYMKTLPYVDSSRIGITGGSYGGYMTALALTRGADTFTHGDAEFAVTDWRLYDNVYTERYMDKPSENPEGYDYGSVMTHANKLKGKLRITAGNMDDNVHYQNTLQLIDKLENLGKDFELMIYANERHGYRIKWRHAAKNNVDFWKRSFNVLNHD